MELEFHWEDKDPFPSPRKLIKPLYVGFFLFFFFLTLFLKKKGGGKERGNNNM